MLYHNVAFRNAIFHWHSKGDLTEDDRVVQELQKVFTFLNLTVNK